MPRADAHGACVGTTGAHCGGPEQPATGREGDEVGMPGTFRVRQGDWRAVYAIKDGNVIVGRVGNRKEVYR